MVASVLAAGDVAIVAYATDAVGGSDDDDLIRFVLLKPIGSGTQIFFTDRSWTGSVFTNAAGDGTFTYTAGADLAAGTVITITSAQLAAAGMNLSDATGDTIYVYQGTDADTPTGFLYAADIADGNATFDGSLANTGLANGTSAVAVGFDQASYAGQSTQIQATQLAKIGTSAQWHGSDADDSLGTMYDDRADTSLSGPLNNPDMQLFAVMAGTGQSDALVRMDNDEGANSATNLTRLFRDNPNFTRLTDLSFDIEDGVWFAADSDGTTSRILKGNIADLVSGTSTPTISVIYTSSTPDTFIDSIEIDTVNNRVYFTEGDIFVGHSLKRADYDGAGLTDYGPVALAIDPNFGFFAGGVYDFALDVAHDTAYLTYVLVDTLFSDPPTAPINYIVKVNSLADAGGGYSIVPINGSDDPDDGGGFLPAGHFPDSEGSLRGIDIDIANQILYFVTGRLGPDGTAGIFKLDLTTGNYTEIWEQPSNNAFNTLQPFPTSLLEDIEVDTIGGRYYVTTLNNSDTAASHDGTATDEGGSRIFSGALNATPGTAPTLFASVFEPTANGAAFGMEIDYAPVLTLSSAGVGYTETAGSPSPAGPPADVASGVTVSDADQAVIKGATVAITGGFAAGDTLTFTPSGGITGSYNAATGVLTLTGNATFAQYQTVLDSVGFTTPGDNPDDYGDNPTRTVSFTVFDGLINSDPAVATIAVNSANDAPVNTTGGPISILEGSPPVAITGLAVSDVDADPAADTISVTLSATLGTIDVSDSAPGGLTAGQISGNGTGSVVLSGTQNQINATLSSANGVTYTAASGGVDALVMTTNDLGHTGAGGAQQDVDAVVITVIGTNDPPTAPATNSVTTAEDNTSAATAIGATDPDGDTLTYSEKPGAEAAHGTVTFDQANGTFTYAPDPDYNGSDSFTILISDGQGGTDEQVVSVTVTPVNDAPDASATNSVTTAEDSASAATAIGASDVDGDTLAYSEKPGAGPAHGSVSFNQAAGTFTYTPAPNYNGSDSFTIVIDDGHGGTAEQAVSVTVTGVNDAPTAPANGSVTTAEDTASAATAIGASDIDGDTLSYSQKAGAEAVHGSVSFNAGAGTFTYTPSANYSGPDSFTILIDDNHGGTAEQVVSVNVTPTNDPPTGVTGTLSAPEDAVNGSAAGTIVAQDPDSSSFTYTLLNNAGGRFAMDSAGHVTVADGLLLDYEQASSHTIRVRVTDDMGASSEFDTTVSVVDVLGEDVLGDGRNNVFWGGAEDDVLRGMDGNDTLKGGGGQDHLEGGNGADNLDGQGGNDNLVGGAGNDTLNGGAGQDTLRGGSGDDIYIFRKGEADGDTIFDFFGNGTAIADSIRLEGYAPGTTFTRIGNGNSTLWEINDHGYIEHVTIYATGQVHPTDYTFIP
jgi:VCBS repeat-containing protein